MTKADGGQALVEKLKAERADKLRKAANKAEFALADATAKTGLLDLKKADGNVVPIKRDILMVATTDFGEAKARGAKAKAEQPKEEPKAETKSETQNDERPVIELGPKDSPRLINVVATTMKHLTDRGAQIFQRGGTLMRPIDEPAFDSEGNPVKVASLLQVDEGSLQLLLMNHLRWSRKTKDGETRYVNPLNTDVASLILKARGAWPFPPVSGVINAPTLRPDGSPLNKEGFDSATGLLLLNAPIVTIKLRPTRADAEASLELLKGLLTEAPFVSEADRSVALSLILSLVLRGALETPPLHSFASPDSGAGKSFLVNIASKIATGERCAVMGATRIGEELEKKLNSALLAGRSLISLDNFNGVLSSGLLCQALTEPMVMVRPLGKSTEVPVASRFVFAATGNNLLITDDLDRRVLLAMLDAKTEHAWQRQFKQDPLEMIARDRARYLEAALTIPLAYIAAGYPDLPPILNSFSRWSKLVRGSLMWLGAADPVSTLLAAISSSPKLQATAAMLAAMRDAFGMGPAAKHSAQEILDAANPKEVDDFRSILGSALERPAKQKVLREALNGLQEDGKDLPTRLTYWLRPTKGRVIGSLRLCAEENLHTHSNWWYVEPAMGGNNGE